MKNTDIRVSKQTEKDLDTIQKISEKIAKRYKTEIEIRAIESKIGSAVFMGIAFELLKRKTT